MRKSDKLLSVLFALIILIGVVCGIGIVSEAKDSADNSVNLTVGENIVSHYYIDAAFYRSKGCDKIRYTYNGTDSEEKFTAITKTVNLTSDETVTIDAYQAAAQIAEPTVIEIMKGSEVYDTVSYSSTTYCDEIINMDEGDMAALSITKGRTLKGLCKAIIEYGKAAQKEFDYSAETVDGATTITGDYFDELGIADATYIPSVSKTAGENVSFYSASFMCSSSAKMRFYLLVADPSDSTVYPDPVVDIPEDASIQKGYVQDTGNKVYFIQVNNIKPYHFDEKLEINYAGASVSMSVFDYCGTVINSDAMSAKTKTLVKAILVYGNKAKSYFTDHTMSALVPAVDATCTEAGNVAYYQCTDCGKYFADFYGDVELTAGQLVAAPLGHSFNSVLTAPTCTEQGYTTYTCSRCEYSYKDNYVDATGHTPVTDAAVAPTCTETGLTEGSHCSVCSETLVAQTTVDALGHSYGAWTVTTAATLESSGTETRICANDSSHKETRTIEQFTCKLENRDIYLYRVGNSNNIRLGTLFDSASGASISNVSATVTVKGGNAAATVTNNASDWRETTVKFTGEGVVTLTLKHGGSDAATLNLEVITGKNITAYSQLSNGSTNIMLSDIALTSGANISFSGAIYGNGFTFDASKGLTTKTGVIMLSANAKLDNIVIEGHTENAYVDSFGSTGYSSTVTTEGDGSVITNCRITGGQTPLRINSVATVKDTVASGGFFANVDVRGGEFTADNLTTVNTQNSLGIVVAAGASDQTRIIIENALTQHNFISENDDLGSTNANTLRSTMFGGNYARYQFTSGSTKYVNAGIISMSESVGASNITDNRADKKYYSGMTASLMGKNGYVYTMENTDFSALETSYTEPEYIPGVQKLYEPSFTWALSSADNVAAGGNEHCYKDGSGKLQIQVTTGNSKTLDVAKLATVRKYGTKSYAPAVSCTGPNNTPVAVTNGSVSFSAAGEYILSYTYTDDYIFDTNAVDSSQTQTYTKTIKVNVTVKKMAPNAIITSSANSGTIVWGRAGSSFDPDYNPCIPFLNGLTITDYDANGNAYTVLDGSNQASFISSISNVTVSSRTVTITLANSTKLVVNGPAVDGSVQIKTYNNIMYYCDSTADNNPAAFTKSFAANSYTYTGENGVAVSYGTARSFTSTTSTETIATYSSMGQAWTSNRFLMYDAQGGEVSPTYASASPATLPTPTREGYTFVSWNTKADGTGTASNAGTSKAFSSTTTLYAIWAENVTVSFNKNGASANPEPVISGAGMSAALPDASYQGYWLEGWYTEALEGARIGGAGESFIIPESDTTYYAHWSPVYTVTYNANGGTAAADSDTYEGSALILPSASLTGKTFEGWFTDSEGGESVGVSGDSYVPSSDITLFAHYSDNIKVSYDGNGGNASTGYSTYDKVTPIILPNATRDGYSFNGWYTEAAGGTKIGSAGDSYAPANETTLYAQWSAYTVTYDANGGTLSPASGSGVVTLPTPSRTGYTFNGWYTDETGGSKVGSASDSYAPTADITLHAQWSINSYSVSITTSNSSTAVSVGGASVSSGGSVEYNNVVKVVLSYTQTSSLTFTIKQGNTNVTYYTDEGCTSSTTSTAAGTYYFRMPAGDVTINSSSSSGGGTCITPDTLVTLADGSQKRADELTGEEELLIWNPETGRYDTAPILFMDNDSEGTYNVVHLRFSDGTETRLISEHGYFDVEEAKYVYITEENYRDYIGHHFVKAESIENNTWTTVELVDAAVTEEVTTPYGPTTSGQFCFFVDGMLSMPGGIKGLFNIFDIDASTMTYDSEAMQRDIETYGLYTYDDFGELLSQEVFEITNCAYLKISVGKGLMTWEDVVETAKRYAPLAETYFE